MPKKSGTHHVVPNAEGGWDVKKAELPVAVVTMIASKMRWMLGAR